MSKPAMADVSMRCDYLDKHAAAKYLNGQGFHSVTPRTIMHAARMLKTLHAPRRAGKTYFWHRDWLDQWVQAL